MEVENYIFMGRQLIHHLQTEDRLTSLMIMRASKGHFLTSFAMQCGLQTLLKELSSDLCFGAYHEHRNVRVNDFTTELGGLVL